MQLVSNQLQIFQKQNKVESKVKITADEAGNVIVKSKNNPEWGYIRVEQTRFTVDDDGIARDVTMSALIPGKIESLAKWNATEGKEISGKIIYKESLTGFRKVDADKDLKVAGFSGVVCTLNGSPIYRKNFYTLDENAQDVAIAHDNGDEISQAYASEESQVSDAQFDL